MTAHRINASILWSLATWAALIVAVCRCANLNQYAGGGGTETVVGMVVNADGSSAAQTAVELLPSDFNPAAPVALGYEAKAETNDSGVYTLKNVPAGEYTLQAVRLDTRTRALKAGVIVSEGNPPASVDTLRAAGTVVVDLPGGIDPAETYVYIPGTRLYVALVNSGGSITFDSVPSGILPEIAYALKNGAERRTIRYRVEVSPAETTVVKNPAWCYARRVFLNTSASGAQINGDVVHFPALIRLTEVNFNFTEAGANGKDIRFRKSDDTPIPFEIERWDATGKQAELWVKVDTVHGNNATQSITMYWGNPAASDSSISASVFDTSDGFVGVWHLGKSGAAASDATANGNDGVATATTAVSGVVGNAQQFNGTSSLIRTSGPNMDKLNFQENGTYSVSAWVRTNVLDSAFHGIVYKSTEQYGLQMRPKNEWEFYTYFDKSRWEMSRSPASDNSWHALTGVRNGSKQYLYVDGRCLDSSIITLSTNLARVTDQPLEIGHCPDGGNDPDRFFNGAIDEVRISSVANNADWIKLCYMNQKEQDALIKW